MPSFDPMSAQHSFCGVERHAEAALIPADRGLAKLLHALVRRIAMVARLGGRLLHRGDDVRRRRQVGIADAEVDEILALRPQRRLLLVDVGEQVGRAAP